MFFLLKNEIVGQTVFLPFFIIQSQIYQLIFYF